MDIKQPTSWPRVITGSVLVAMPSWPVAGFLGHNSFEAFVSEEADMGGWFMGGVALLSLALALLPAVPVWGGRSTRVVHGSVLFALAAVPAWLAAAGAMAL